MTGYQVGIVVVATVARGAMAATTIVAMIATTAIANHQLPSVFRPLTDITVYMASPYVAARRQSSWWLRGLSPGALTPSGRRRR